MKNNPQALSTTVLSLPEIALTKGGYQFFPNEDVWSISDVIGKKTFNFNAMMLCLSDELLFSLKKTLVWFLSNSSVSHSINLFYRFKNFLIWFSTTQPRLSEVTSDVLVNYRSHLSNQQSYFLSTLSGLFKKWYELGYPGVHPNVPKLFDELRLQGNKKGEAVRIMDPERGPFTDLELQAIHAELNNSFGNGNINIDDFVLISLFTAVGARSVQFASLKCKDLLVGRDGNGAVSYTLNVPSAKKRSIPVRGQFKQRKLIQKIGEVLETWITHLKKTAPIEEIDKNDLPIFPDWHSDSMPGFEHHMGASKLGAKVKKTCSRLNVISERTGDPIRISSKRFRYTLGTRAAEEGNGELVIADLLDHSDTQNVGIYVEATPAIAERIDKATALELAPIAQAFAGLIIEDESKADRGDDLASRIGDPNIGNVGSCGKYGFCSGLAPIACYTCKNFHPWLDAPHEELLELLVADRERLLANNGDERIAVTNDRVILAVADVVQRCDHIRESKGNA